MFRSMGVAILTAMTMAFFSPACFADAQMDVQKLWEGSGYAHPGKGMRTMKMMHMMDTNKDSKVSKEEFMAYYEMVWDKMDSKHVGFIEVNEWIGQGSYKYNK